MAKTKSGIIYTWTPAFKSSSTSAGMSDRHSKDWAKVTADRHVKSVIEEKSERRRAFPYPVLRFLSGRKKVDGTAIPRVLRQATVQNPQISDRIVNVWVVLAAQRARPDGKFLQ